jgi:hypothetical protein
VWEAIAAKSFPKAAALVKTLSEAICILPDDAEPEVGDLHGQYYPEEQIYSAHYITEKDMVDESTTVACAKKMSKECGWRILMRNGKPVIYESQLEGGV